MGYQQLSTDERYSIAAMRASGHITTEIARELKRHRSTIDREVERNRCVHDGYYRAMFAVQKANGRRSRSRRNQRYAAEHFAPIEHMLREDFSPEQIVGRLRIKTGDIDVKGDAHRLRHIRGIGRYGKGQSRRTRSF